MSITKIESPTRRFVALLLGVIGAVGACAAGQCATGSAQAATARDSERQRTEQAYAKLPLRFEENRGQTDRQARYVARSNGFNLFLTATEAVMDLRSPGGKERSVVRMRMVDARTQSRVAGEGEITGRSNYLLGKDRSKWKRNVPGYGKVRYQSVYPGVDALFYGRGRELEYDFLVAAGADPSAIRLAFQDERDQAVPLQIAGDGSLVMRTKAGEVKQHAPVAYQERGGKRQAVTAKYVRLANAEIGVKLGEYDRSRPLVIDPVLTYSTYLGGQRDDEAFAVASDASGNGYVAGITNSVDFPISDGTLQPVLRADHDAFVVKLSPGNCALIYSTYLGGGVDSNGPGLDRATSLAVDGSSRAYVGGYTDSTDFPTTLGAFQEVTAGSGDGFVAKLTEGGDDLIYCSCLGGSSGVKDEIRGLALDEDENLYAVGITGSDDFPTTPGAYQPDFRGGNTDGFVTKFNAGGTALVYSSFLGGGPSIKSEGNDFANAVAVDDEGNAYVTGGSDALNFPKSRPLQKSIEQLDAFAVKVNPTGSGLVFSTLLGGAKDEWGNAIAVGSDDRVYIAGTTASTSFPSGPKPFEPYGGGDTDGFVLRLNAEATTIQYFGFIGGAGRDFATGIGVDSNNRAWVCGGINWQNANPGNAINAKNLGDGYVKELNAAGSKVIYSLTLGGRDLDSANALSLDAFDNVYIVGGTDSNNFNKGKVGAFQPKLKGETEAFVAKIGIKNSPAPVLTIQPRHLRFESRDGDQPIKKVRLTNSGKTPVGFAIVKVKGPFFNVSGFSDGVVEPGQTRYISIQFRPVRGERHRGAMVISTTLPGSKACVGITLYGKAKDTLGGGNLP